jgi:broad-specificity NMP kinase
MLITGMSGTGKSTLMEELGARGHHAVDLDGAEWSEYRATAAPDLAPGDSEWVWREDRVRELLDNANREALFVSGCASNMVQFYPRFDHIVLLSAPIEVMLERLASRTNNSYGKRPEEIEAVRFNHRTVEPLLRRVATAELDSRATVGELADRVLLLAGVRLTR